MNRPLRQIFFDFVLLIALSLPAAVSAQSLVRADNLRCCSLVDPEGIDVFHPLLSWNILSGNERDVRQTAFEVMVASSMEKLQKGEADLWNSGLIRSTSSIRVAYEGKPLKSTDVCYWKVKIYTNHGTSLWSRTAYWSMGLLKSTDWKGSWIGLDRSFPWDRIEKNSRLSARYLRREFTSMKKIKSAYAFVSGLGFYELYLNGRKVGQQLLTPVATDFTKTVLYNTFNVTEFLKRGDNAIGVILGNGRYFTMRQQYKPKKIKNFGYPRLLFQLLIRYEDGSSKMISSDRLWKITADGPIRSNNIYDGEIYDANKELNGWNLPGYRDRGWLGAELVKAPGGTLHAQMQPFIKIEKQLPALKITEPRRHHYVIDFGQNLAGWVKSRLQASRGDSIWFHYSEKLDSNGMPDYHNLRDALSTDIYVAATDRQAFYQPRFTYHGFRYVEITGIRNRPSLSDLEAMVISDDLDSTGQFVSSDSVLNGIYHNASWSILSNYKGLPLDCPQRNERMPWLADRTNGALGESFLYGNETLYAQWLRDIRDAQTLKGSIPDVCPAYWNYYTDNVTWPGTYLSIAEMLYRQYGNESVIRDHYPSMKKWMDYMKANYFKAGLITKDKYGDWCMPPLDRTSLHSRDSSLITDGTLIATATYYHYLKLMETFALVSGHGEDRPFYEKLADSICAAFNRTFFDSHKYAYGNGTITADVLPYYFDMVPEKAKIKLGETIAESIRLDHKYHISTGVIGTGYLMRTLTASGRSDLAYRIATNRDYPGWGYMLERGATTIWELWNGDTAPEKMNSYNHVMLLGDLLSWYYEHLAAIQCSPDTVAFKKILMKPELIDGLDSVKASYQSPYGLIASHWHRYTDHFHWKIEIPCNTQAEIWIPSESSLDIEEGGHPLRQAEGIHFERMQGRYAVLLAGSGSYDLRSYYPFRRGILKDEFISVRPPFPESHSSTIVETPRGLVAGWFGGHKEGNKDVCIYLSFYKDGHWSEPLNVADGIQNDTLRYPAWNPVLYQEPEGGDLLLFYKVGPNIAHWVGYMKRSSDGGHSWSPAEQLPDGFLGAIKNKPVLITRKGEKVLLCPSSTEATGWKVHIEQTTDWGKSWKKTDTLNDGKNIRAIQPSILTYPDGRLQLLCRSKNPYKNRAIMTSWSSDGGLSWSPMDSTILPNNNSGIDAVTLRNGWQLVVYNHVKMPYGSAKGIRTPLNVAVSKDGIHWLAALTLEDVPDGQYSYPAVIESSDGLVHIVYTWRREKIKHVVVDPEKIVPVEMNADRWPAAPVWEP